jgi:hypothetical protein
VAELVSLDKGLLQQTLVELRTCGADCAECVVFWTGPVAEPELVDGLLHPRHTSVRGGYEIDEDWLADIWPALAGEGRAIRCQVHTHPRDAFHSATDDAFPIVHSVGFLSLVIPRFARPPQTLADAYLARLESDGGWSSHDPRAMLGIGMRA